MAEARARLNVSATSDDHLGAWEAGTLVRLVAAVCELRVANQAVRE